MEMFFDAGDGGGDFAGEAGVGGGLKFVEPGKCVRRVATESAESNDGALRGVGMGIIDAAEENLELVFDGNVAAGVDPEIGFAANARRGMSEEICDGGEIVALDGENGDDGVALGFGIGAGEKAVQRGKRGFADFLDGHEDVMGALAAQIIEGFQQER